jgi:hypothetical protein
MATDRKGKFPVEKFTVDLDLQDLTNLRSFCMLPEWVSKEWDEKFGEANCDPLPIREIRSLVGQMDRELLRRSQK